MIKVGVVIPTYKREKLLKRAIESVLNQSYSNYIICVVDDLSPDNTTEMMKKYETNDKVHYIRLKKNSGVNIARNRAMDYLLSDDIQCDYIIWLDDDDYFILSTLKELVHVINKTKSDWIVSNKVTPSGEKMTKVERYGYNSFLYDYLSGLNINGEITTIMSKELIGSNRMEESLRGREDLFFLKLHQQSNMYVVDFDATVSEYLSDGMTKSKLPSKLKKEEKQKAREITTKNLLELNMTYEELEYIKFSGRLLNSIKNKKYKTTFRFLRKLIILIFTMMFKMK